MRRTVPAGSSPSIESRVYELGSHWLNRARELHDRAWLRHKQEQLLLGQIMNDDALRVRMLRFIDLLPALTDDEQLVGHLDEYFAGKLPIAIPVLSRFPAVTQWGLRHARHGIAAHAVAGAVRATVNRMAKRFIAGDNIPDVLRTIGRLHEKNLAFTLDLLGEATVSEPEAVRYQLHYLRLLDELPEMIARWPDRAIIDSGHGRRLPRLNLSVKLSSLYSQMDPVDADGCVRIVKDRLRPILHAARRVGAFINLDMEQYDFKAMTLRVFRELLDERELRDWPDVGVAMQAYLRDTPEDLRAIIEWARHRGTPVTVRLVRGAYWDYETVIAQQNHWPIPVWTHKSDTDACYEQCVRMLMEHYPHVHAAIATHNVRSLAIAAATAEQFKLTHDQFEFQMLLGMADELKQTIVDAGHRLRVYVPFGQLLPGMAYLVRRLLENTSNQSFLRMGFTDDAPIDVLLTPPRPARAEPLTHPHDQGYVSESVRRFTDEREIRAMSLAIDHVQDQLGGDYPLMIAGEYVATVDWINSTNPAQPQQIVGRAGAATGQHVHDAIRAAHDAQRNWSSLTFTARAACLINAGNIMRQHRDELAAWEMYETGKPWREADTDVVEAIDFLNYYAHEAMRLDQPEHFDVPGETNAYFYEPRGVGVVISPWNFPLAIVTGMVAAGIVTGNTVVLKPAPQSPVLAAKLVEILTQAGIPAGVVNYLPGDDDTGKALVRHRDIDFIAFTGSRAVGCEINAVASQVQPGQDHLKRIILEMGGKNAIIVDSDADLDDAVRGCVVSAFGYAGQKCSAASRIIVVGSLYDVFLKRFIEATASISIGQPIDRGTFIGPVIDAAAKQNIERAIETGKSCGRIAYQGDVSHLNKGHYVSPTIFADVDPHGSLAQEEIFGPVVAVMHGNNFEQAIDIANSTVYSLTGGVYSRSPARLEQARRTFRVGNLYLNRKITGAIVGRQPFGGMKMSGIGSKAGGPDYLLQFVEPRTITENTIRRGFAPSEPEQNKD